MDANSGHAFGILLAFVGTLRTCGAPAPLTWVLGSSLASTISIRHGYAKTLFNMHPRLSQTPRALQALLCAIVVGTLFFALQQPFVLGTFLIKMGLLCYLAWGTLGGRKSATWLLTLFLAFSVYVNAVQLAEDPSWTSRESIVQIGWSILLIITMGNVWLSRSTREHLKRMRNEANTQ